jgi:hypothetical protein
MGIRGDILWKIMIAAIKDEATAAWGKEDEIPSELDKVVTEHPRLRWSKCWNNIVAQHPTRAQTETFLPRNLGSRLSEILVGPVRDDIKRLSGWRNITA